MIPESGSYNVAPRNAVMRALLIMAATLAPLHDPVVVANAGPVPAESATISGLVTYRGAVPLRTVADNEGRKRPLLTVNGKSSGLRYAVVYLIPAEGAPETSRPAAESDQPPVAIDQVDYEFVPRVVAVRAGQRISVTNSDFANHNVRTVGGDPKNSFNTMTPADRTYERTIQPEESGRPIRLACDIHPWMMGWIYLFDHDWCDVTDENGRFTIEGILPDRYTLVAQQPDGRLEARKELHLHAGEHVNVDVGFTEFNLDNKAAGAIRVTVE
jgi:plastocyanin